MARRIEMLSGLAAGLIGVATLLFTLYGPTGRIESAETRPDGTIVTSSGATSMLESQSFSVVLILFLTVMTVSLFGVAFGSWTHATSGSAAGFTLLWLSTIALAGGAMLSLLSIGLFFMPSVLLAIIACIAGRARSSQRQPPGPSHA
ncbi:MAG TPA: hypothetical protein VMM78_17530 [Thermomicrobiales bacterium]|nr:hypothetical protein [Thermomicrobiales bacterium]